MARQSRRLDSEDRQRAANLQRIVHSPSYRLAYKDVDFLTDPRLRPARMELELLKPELVFEDHKVTDTIVVFGGTRFIEPARAKAQLRDLQAKLAETPDDPRRQRAVARAERVVAYSPYYEVAREFARLVSSQSEQGGKHRYVIVTGGGPGIMEAANRGAYDVEAKSVGLNIRLPTEQEPNPYITPDLCFQFHYFAIRKFHFVLRAKALVVCPGGFGTLDELFEVLTLRQTRRMQDIPIILFGRSYWEKALNFQFLADEGAINDEDLDLIHYAESAQEAWNIIVRFHEE